MTPERNIPWRWLAALLPLSLAACSISLANEAPPVSNLCSATADCSGDGVCSQGMCVATKSDIPDLLVQANVPSTAKFAAGVSTLVSFSHEPQLFGQNGSGLRQQVDLVLPDMAVVNSSITMPVEQVQPACADLLAEDGTFPLIIELWPELPVTSLPLPVYGAGSEEGTDTKSITLSVPAGRYNVYLIPQIPDETPDDKLKYADCHMPPTVLPNRSLGQGQVAIGVTLAAPTALNGTISGLDLDGWSIQLLDNDNGRPLSEAVSLTTVSAMSENNFELHYWDQLVQSEQVDAVLRLAPPDSQAVLGMPTLLWKLAAVDLDGDQQVALDVSALSSMTATPLDVSGSVYNGSEGVPAEVIIQSNELLSGELGGNAFFKTSIHTDADGRYSAMLLPGSYTLTAIPNENVAGFAITSTTVELNSESLGSAIGIEVNFKSNLAGTTVDPSGDTASGVDAWLQAANADTTSFLQDKLLATEPLPDGVNTATDFNGGFNMEVDPGLYDLSIRPSTDSGLPWLVRPRIAIQPASEPTTAELGDLNIPYPVVLEGVVRSPEGILLPGTLVRAWLPATNIDEADEEAPAPSVVQIAETISDDSGRYQLLLPPSLSQ